MSNKQIGSTRKSHLRGFTIVELLVIVVTLGIIMTIVVSYMNPAQIIANARDTTRLNDLSSLDKTINIAKINGLSLGTSNKIYISLPDTSSTCANLTLPTLPAGWSYNCVTSANLRKTNGTGWMPVNTSANSSILPIDPTNQLPGSYYSYATNGTKYELTTSMESTNNKYNGINDRTSTDGGTSYAMYEIGSDLSINPQNSVLLNLVAYWKFNETSGNAIDSIGGLSATNNNVTYATGFKGNAAVFNGSNSYLRATLAMSSGAGSADSFAIWVYQTGAQNQTKGLMNSGYGIHLWENVNRTIIYGNWTSVTNEQFNSTGTILDNQWNLVVVTSLSAGSSKCYINGVLAGQNNISGNLVNAGYIEFGRHPGYNDNYFNGKLDNAGYWNRVLSQDEVKLLYGAGAGLSYP